MARKATFRERSGIALSLMDVVARGAAHARRRLIAPAALQKRDLIAVNIRRRNSTCQVSAKIFVERFSWNIRKRISERCAKPAMALRTNVDLIIAIQVGRVNNICCLLLCRHCFHVRAPPSMAAYARYPVDQTLRLELV